MNLAEKRQCTLIKECNITKINFFKICGIDYVLCITVDPLWYDASVTNHVYVLKGGIAKW